MILFLVRMSLTSLDMLVKAPGWMSWMMLLETLTERSFGCELSTRGVRESAIIENVRIKLFVPQAKFFFMLWIKNTPGFCFLFLQRLSYLK